MTRQRVHTVAFLSLIVWLLARPEITRAGSPCLEDLAYDSQIVSQVQLSPLVPRQGSRGPNQVIHESQVLVPFKDGLRAWIAGSADGQSEMVTDDAVQVTVTDTGSVWKHDFRTGPNRAIEAIPPQDLTHLFKVEPGGDLVAFHVAFESRDLLVPEYRSSEYWLVVWRSCLEEEPTVLPTATPTPAAPTQEPLPIIATTIVPPTAVPTVPPTPSDTPTPVASSVPAEYKLIQEDVPQVSMVSLGLALPNWAIGSGIGFLVVVIGAVTWMSVAKSQYPQGRVVIHDAETGEYVDTYNLTQQHKKAVEAGPNSEIWLPKLSMTGPVARIYVQSKGTDQATVMDLLSELDSTQVMHTIELYDGFRYTFDSVYTLTYFTQQEAEDTRNSEENDHEYYA